MAHSFYSLVVNGVFKKRVLHFMIPLFVWQINIIHMHGKTLQSFRCMERHASTIFTVILQHGGSWGGDFLWTECLSVYASDILEGLLGEM